MPPWTLEGTRASASLFPPETVPAYSNRPMASAPKRLSEHTPERLIERAACVVESQPIITICPSEYEEDPVVMPTPTASSG